MLRCKETDTLDLDNLSLVTRSGYTKFNIQHIERSLAFLCNYILGINTITVYKLAVLVSESLTEQSRQDFFLVLNCKTPTLSLFVFNPILSVFDPKID